MAFPRKGMLIGPSQAEGVDSEPSTDISIGYLSESPGPVEQLGVLVTLSR